MDNGLEGPPYSRERVEPGDTDTPPWHSIEAAEEHMRTFPAVFRLPMSPFWLSDNFGLIQLLNYFVLFIPSFASQLGQLLIIRHNSIHLRRDD